MLWISLSIIGVIVLLLIVFAALQVDDWSRDLSTNFAETAEEAEHPSLRPLQTKRPSGDIIKAVHSVVERLPSWKVEGEEPDGKAVVLKLTRTTSLWRFTDDVTVSISSTDTGNIVNAQSQSRVGRGDLGQNPRNLKELLSKLRAELGDAE